MIWFYDAFFSAVCITFLIYWRSQVAEQSASRNFSDYFRLARYRSSCPGRCLDYLTRGSFRFLDLPLRRLLDAPLQ